MLDNFVCGERNVALNSIALLVLTFKMHLCTVKEIKSIWILINFFENNSFKIKYFL